MENQNTPSVENAQSNGQMQSVRSGTWLAVGASVTWCHSTSNGRSIGFSTRRGKIVQINHENGMAFVKYRQKHLWVQIKRLRSASARTELTEMVMGEVAESDKRMNSYTQEQRAQLEHEARSIIASANTRGLP